MTRIRLKRRLGLAVGALIESGHAMPAETFLKSRSSRYAIAFLDPPFAANLWGAVATALEPDSEDEFEDATPPSELAAEAAPAADEEEEA